MQEMAKEAEGFAESDKAKREAVETRNEADAAVHNTKKNLDEHKSNLPQEVQDDVQTKIVEVEQVLANEDATAEEIRTSVDELQQAAMKMGEAIYKSQSAEGESGAESGKDAEYEDVKEDDKKTDKDGEGKKKD